MKKASITILLLFLLVKMTTPVYSQEKFVQIPSNIFSNYYLDNSRIIKYMNSRLLDVWTKKIITEKERSMEMKKNKLNKKNSKQEKERAELLKNTYYQLIHQQFDPLNFQYKVLEVYSYNVNSQLLSSSKNQFSWAAIPVDSIEERTLTYINDCIENSADRVIFR